MFCYFKCTYFIIPIAGLGDSVSYLLCQVAVTHGMLFFLICFVILDVTASSVSSVEIIYHREMFLQSGFVFASVKHPRDTISLQQFS